MGNSKDEQEHNNNQPRNDKENNPFVAFRRFADEQINSIFDKLAEPFHGDLWKNDEAWKDAQREAWKRFESSYERATNPERRQTERRSKDDPIHDAPVPRYRSLEAQTNEERERHSNPGLFERTMTALGKTSKDEEFTRATATSSETDAEQERRRCGRWPRTRSVVVTPLGTDTTGKDDDVDRRHGQGQFGPFGWSWSWGPWNIETRHQSEDPGDRDAQTHTNTFGPWEFGPIRVGPMTTSATFPKDLEQQVKSFVDEHESRIRQALAEQKVVDIRSPETSAEVEEARSACFDYNPILLSLGDATRDKLDWCSAFEDLMAAEVGQELRGSVRQKAPPGLMHQLGFLHRMQARQLIDQQAPWHQGIFYMGPQAFAGFAGPPRSPKVWEVEDKPESERGPESELDFYERQEEAARAQAQAWSPPQDEHSKSELVSRISSVERVVMPDGAIKTKRTLRRRYADGSEDTEDSTEETPPPKRPVEDSSASSALATNSEQSNAVPSQNKASWFW